MSIYEFHYVGGMTWMVILSIILLTNTSLIILAAYHNLRNKLVPEKWFEAIKQLGMLALAWGAFSTIVAFYQAFGDLSSTEDNIPFEVIMGGSKVALMTVLYGFGIFLFSLLCLSILRFTKKETA